MQAGASIPNAGECALMLEYRLVDAASNGVIGEHAAEIVQAVTDERKLDVMGLLAWGRALHAAAAVCVKHGDEDAEILHALAQRLIGLAYDRMAFITMDAATAWAKH